MIVQTEPKVHTDLVWLAKMAICLQIRQMSGADPVCCFA
jgi:hypothetical protein